MRGGAAADQVAPSPLPDSLCAFECSRAALRHHVHDASYPAATQRPLQPRSIRCCGGMGSAGFAGCGSADSDSDPLSFLTEGAEDRVTPLAQVLLGDWAGLAPDCEEEAAAQDGARPPNLACFLEAC